MTILVHKLAKLYKQSHPVHHESEEELSLSDSLQDFRSQISKFVAQLGFIPEQARSENLSLSWIVKCFALLSVSHKALAKLVVDIDHPISKWSSDSIEGYLNYCLRLLELFNSISSSLSRLGQSRLSLSYGLIKFKKSPCSAKNHLKGIEIGSPKLSPNFGYGLCKESERSRDFCGKERVLREAIEELKILGFWVCGVVLSGLSSDASSYLELRKISCGFPSSCLVLLPLESKIGEKMPVLQEVKEINDAVGDLLAASESDDAVKVDVAMELQKKVDLFQKALDDLSKEVGDEFSKVMAQRNEVDAAVELQKKVDLFQKVLDDLSKEVDDVFSKVMVQRNELIDSFRFKKPSQKSGRISVENHNLNILTTTDHKF